MSDKCLLSDDLILIILKENWHAIDQKWLICLPV